MNHQCSFAQNMNLQISDMWFFFTFHVLSFCSEGFLYTSSEKRKQKKNKHECLQWLFKVRRHCYQWCFEGFRRAFKCKWICYTVNKWLHNMYLQLLPAQSWDTTAHSEHSQTKMPAYSDDAVWHKADLLLYHVDTYWISFSVYPQSIF